MVFTNIRLFITAIRALIVYGTRHYHDEVFVSVVMNAASDEDKVLQITMDTYRYPGVNYEYKEYFVVQTQINTLNNGGGVID